MAVRHCAGLRAHAEVFLFWRILPRSETAFASFDLSHGRGSAPAIHWHLPTLQRRQQLAGDPPIPSQCLLHIICRLSSQRSLRSFPYYSGPLAKHSSGRGLSSGSGAGLGDGLGRIVLPDLVRVAVEALPELQLLGAVTVRDIDAEARGSVDDAVVLVLELLRVVVVVALPHLEQGAVAGVCGQLCGLSQASCETHSNQRPDTAGRGCPCGCARPR